MSHFCHGLTKNGKPGYIQSGRGTRVGLFPGPGPSHISWGLWHHHIQPSSSVPYCQSFLAFIWSFWKNILQCKSKPQLFIFNLETSCSSRSWKTEIPPPRGCASGPCSLCSQDPGCLHSVHHFFAYFLSYLQECRFLSGKNSLWF